MKCKELLQGEGCRIRAPVRDVDPRGCLEANPPEGVPADPPDAPTPSAKQLQAPWGLYSAFVQWKMWLEKSKVLTSTVRKELRPGKNPQIVT